MRLTAYKMALEQAKMLPQYLPELRDYFGDEFSPNRHAIGHIIEKARCDDKLYHRELLKLLLEALRMED